MMGMMQIMFILLFSVSLPITPFGVLLATEMFLESFSSLVNCVLFTVYRLSMCSFTPKVGLDFITFGSSSVTTVQKAIMDSGTSLLAGLTTVVDS